MFFAKRSEWLSRLGIRAQLVLFFLAVFGGLFVLFSVGMYAYIAEIHRDEFDAALYNYVVDASHSLGAAPQEDVLFDSELILPFSMGETLLQVTSPDGVLVVKSHNLGTHTLPLRHREGTFFDDIRLAGGRYRMVSHSFAREASNQQYLIQAAVPMILLDRQAEGLLMFLSVAVPLLLVLAAISGLFFSRRAMAPVAAIIDKTRDIEARHLSERIEIPSSRDEMRELALTLNGMLDRLERVFRSQEAFITDASHQLRTPLSILKGELEVFSQRARSPEELQDFLQSARQEIDYLSRIVQNLLVLAQADSEGGHRMRQRFRFDEKLLESIARFTGPAEKKNVQLNVDLQPGEDSFELEGDPELMRSLQENLLDNAIKYSPPGSKVSVRLEETTDSLRFSVRDHGRGIPPDALPQLFNRFYRAEATRHDVPGSGLGLAIVHRIAQLHGGAVKAENVEGSGALFTVVFPKG